MECVQFEDGTILYIEDAVLTKLFKYLQRSNTDKEAGGVLIGKQAKGQEEYYLCDVSEPSNMDKRGRFSFVRNKVSAQRIINKKWHESNGIENYLGEWHSHPENRPTPSHVDRSLIRQIVRDGTNAFKKVFLIIVGKDQSLYANQELKKGVEKQRKRAENVSMWQTNLIKLYCAVCDNSSTIEAVTQRQSNNFRPQFTDEECITVYLWGISQRRFEQKTIYKYTKNHLSEWFPKLPSYQAFSDRLNRLAPAFQALAETWLAAIGVDWNEQREYIVDSCPIILAKGPRSSHGKVARELCETSYNSSRKEWYYGIKLHAVVARRPGRLPLPVSLMASSAAKHDLPVAKQILEDHVSLKQGRLYADKAYIDATWKSALRNDHAIELITPRKKRKEDIGASYDTFSTFVSSLRQSIECFFNWLNRLTAIQTASSVRSLSGLLLHLFGRIAAALISLIFYP